MVQSSVLSQLPSSQWDEGTAAHLLSRAGFGGTPEEIAGVHAKGLARAVQELVEPGAGAVDVSAPDWAHPQDLRAMRKEARAAKQDGDLSKVRRARKMEGDELLDLRRWWLGWMGTTPAPLVEKMTLFWHGHFATSAQKVKDGYWMWRQNETLRRHSLGNFVTLTKEVSRDPAMMIYLDLAQSRREHPNENWARELMELFTVGIGNYTETDVRESARAFTGYRLNLASQQFWFAPAQHDAGPKKFLGHSGNFGGDDIIDILARQPACAQFISRKLCRFFIADEPNDALVDAVAGKLRAHNFEMKPVLRDVFSSTEFYASANTQIKSPAQFIVQTCKVLGCDLPAPPLAQNAMRQMGQVLFAPPNVKGWDGGKSWISTSTLLFRNNFANYLINGDTILPEANREHEKGGDLGMRFGARTAVAQKFHRAPMDVAKIAPADIRAKPETLLAQLSRRLLGNDPSSADRTAFLSFLEARKGDTSDETVRGLLHLMMSTPDYQLT